MSVLNNATIYTSTKPIIYNSEDNTATPSYQVNNLSADNSHYYYVYTYSHIVYLINNTLQTCYNDLISQIVANNSGFTAGSSCPFIDYDPTTTLFSLYFDTTSEIYNISFDSNLYGMFPSFYVKNKYIVINNRNGLGFVSIGDNNKWVKVSQNWNSTSTWSPVRSLVFVSDRLPINSEIVVAPTIFNDLTTYNDQTSNFVPKKIITDFGIPFDFAHDARGYLTYTAILRRWISLSGRDRIREIDFKLFFLDRYTSNFVPILIPNNSDVNMKILFKRK